MSGHEYRGRSVPAFYDPQWEHENCGVGFIANIKGRRSHEIVKDALTMLHRMDHRGGCGCEANTGDGAGILTAKPHEFYQAKLGEELQVELPSADQYGCGVVFFPTHDPARQYATQIFERYAEELGLRVLCWRPMPTCPDAADLGHTAREAMPNIFQCFVMARQGTMEPAELERRLYTLRKRAAHRLNEAGAAPGKSFYLCSLSTRVVVYKGMLTTQQLPIFYSDLVDPRYRSHLAMVHSRFSTNTLPSWDRAQPLRWMCHNGEINTVQGNKNWLRSRESLMACPQFGERLSSLFPIIEPDVSDSGAFDNALELLMMSQRSLPEAVMMMIPEAWQNHTQMPTSRREFYDYHSLVQEPWDGPASISFTDGRYIGAVLDRNGLRPSRYWVTADDRVIMASEVGVVDVLPQHVVRKGRLQPGRMFLVDFEQGQIIDDDQLKADLANQRPYGQWLRQQRVCLAELASARPESGPAAERDTVQSAVVGDRPAYGPEELTQRMTAAGYTRETLEMVLIPLVQQGKDPIGSMGNDAALACLSDKPRLVYDYFRQLFAQVTNPPIDSIREEIVMSLECHIGPEHNLLACSGEHARRLRVPHPVLSPSEFASLRDIEVSGHPASGSQRGWRLQSLDMTYPLPPGTSAAGSTDLPSPISGPPGPPHPTRAGGLALRQCLDRLCHEAEHAVLQGVSFLVLSDRAVGPSRMAASALLALGAVHQHLIKRQLRNRVGLIVESGEAREVHHFCLLTGYGGDAIYPYLAYQALQTVSAAGQLPQLSPNLLVATFRDAVGKGMLKVMAKMGISTLPSYKGAQIFEALGLSREVMDRSFTGSASRISGVGFDVLAAEATLWHQQAFATTATSPPRLLSLGDFHWRSDGEQHAWTPYNIADLQQAAQSNDRVAYWRFAERVNRETNRACHLRGLLQIRTDRRPPIPVEEVEPASEIVRRICTGAMSFGSISAEAHESLAVAMNRIGGKSNTGEGGEDPRRFLPLAGGDSKRSAIKQVASGRFGVTAYYLTNADELQIKIAQGAKPGEGGELPGHKVNTTIAATRHSTPGVGLISPPPHHDIYSIEDLAQLIFDLKNTNPAARVSVKLVSEVGVGTVASGVAKAKADNILIAGADGGTGASPLTSIKHAGLPWELGLAETHQALVANGLRSRIRLQTDGQLKTGRDLVIATLLGAEEYGFATAPLIVLGCLMMRKCHLNTCPVGIATQDPLLRAKFAGQPEHVVNYFFMVAEEARLLMAELGFRTINEMVGRSDLLSWDTQTDHWKAKSLDLSLVLGHGSSLELNVYHQQSQDHDLDTVLDVRLQEMGKAAILQYRKTRFELPICNTDRTTGALLSHELTKRYNDLGMPDGTLHIKFYGSAGQSFGAWVTRGVTLEVEGDANDYVGKGLCGGRIIIYPPTDSPLIAEDNVLIGNVALFGATSGTAFFRGIAAERFAVRNSGAIAVVEGVGDHGCEYMTGGRVVVLGSTGRNFAAGMSGGIAFVYDPDHQLIKQCNLGTVQIEDVTSEEDIAELLELIRRHQMFTGSEVAERILQQWPNVLGHFRRVMPVDYLKAMQQGVTVRQHLEPVR
jgi:glutamate synthase (NADPH/NADH) large chain